MDKNTGTSVGATTAPAQHLTAIASQEEVKEEPSGAKESLLLDHRISSRGERKKYSNVKKKKENKLAVVMCQRSPSKVPVLVKILALFMNFRFVAILYVPYLVPGTKYII